MPKYYEASVLLDEKGFSWVHCIKAPMDRVRSHLMAGAVEELDGLMARYGVPFSTVYGTSSKDVPSQAYHLASAEDPMGVLIKMGKILARHPSVEDSRVGNPPNFMRCPIVSAMMWSHSEGKFKEVWRSDAGDVWRDQLGMR